MRRLLLIALLVAACSKGPEADLPTYIGEARSLGAEWALVNEQAPEGHADLNICRRRCATRLREQLQTQLKR